MRQWCARQRRGRSAWFLAFALAGCDTGVAVTRDVVPQLAATDGFIAIAADTNGRVSLNLCLDADMTHCPSFGPLDATHRMAVSRVEAGQYCLVRIAFERLHGRLGLARDIAAEDTRCFDVRPGTIAYPGHFVYRIGDQGVRVSVDRGWEKRAHFEAELRAEFPLLAPWPVEVVRLHDRIER